MGLVRSFLYRNILSRPILWRTSMIELQGRIHTRHLHGNDRLGQDTRPPGHSQLRLDQLKLLNYSMTVDEDKVEATVHTTGLSYSDFDAKNAQPKPNQLMKLTESARFFSHHWPLDTSGRTFRDYAQLTSDSFTFLVTSRMDITEALYDVKIVKSPLDVSIQGGYIGNTSMTSIAKASTKCGIALLSNINQVVFVDKKTRRPKPTPAWWKEKYAKSAEIHKPLKFDELLKPDYILPYKIHVVRSDLDGYGHANWTSYVRFCTDAIYNFDKKGLLPNLLDIDSRCLKSMELMYAGESFDEDILNVYVWSPQEGDNVAVVHIFNESNFVFQGRFEYFPVNSIL